MKLFEASKVNLLFKVTCIITTIIIIFYWILVYMENEDVSHIEVQSVENMKDIALPELTLCLAQPFLEEKLHQINPAINHTDYISYLIGESNVTEIFESIDFDDVTIDLVDYLRTMNFIWKNGTKSDCPGKQYCPFGSFKNNLNLVVKNDIFIKCFGLELNHFIAQGN